MVTSLVNKTSKKYIDFYFSVLRQLHPTCVLLSSKQDDRLVQTLKSLGNENRKQKDMTFIKLSVLLYVLNLDAN